MSDTIKANRASEKNAVITAFSLFLLKKTGKLHLSLLHEILLEIHSIRFGGCGKPFDIFRWFDRLTAKKAQYSVHDIRSLP
jgi:hypothetical protein